MTEVSQFEFYAESVLYYIGIVLFVLVPALTAFFAFKAFQHSKKKGYILIAAFALTPYITFSLNKISYQLHRDEIQKMNSQRSDGVLIVERNITFPIYNLIFAAGVFILAKAEKKNGA
jgi:hypothetical protein